MAAPQNAFSLYGQYLAARLAAMGMTCFSVDDNLETAAAFGRVMYRLDKRHRRRATAAIARSFPEFSQKQVADVVQRSFEHFLQLAVEVIHTPREIHHESWADRINIGSLEQGIEHFNDGQGFILLTGHIGNWEVCGYTLATLGYDVDAIARPIDHPLINDWLLGIRERQGMRIITKWDATERMLNVLDTGGALAFIADQNAGDRGIFVPFFGRLASSYKSIALLAINQNVPILCGAAHRTGPGFRYNLMMNDIITPDDWVDHPYPLFYVTARYNRAMEQAIGMHPEQYLWMHRRWKSRPRHEREGKAMPKAMRKQLESLPWMTDDLMKQLEVPEPVQK